ncbi:MAG: amidase family protein, partial [Verrucomicrobiota bacterium]
MNMPRRNSIPQWQEEASRSPEQLVDRFLSEAQILSPVNTGSLIASHHKRNKMLEQLKAGCAQESAPLSGVPYILQDMIDVAGLPTLCGAPFKQMLDAPLEDSSLLHQKLGRLGATFFAKTVPAEFGVDLQGRNKTHGACPHPAGGLRRGQQPIARLAHGVAGLPRPARRRQPPDHIPLPGRRGRLPDRRDQLLVLGVRARRHHREHPQSAVPSAAR